MQTVSSTCLLGVMVVAHLGGMSWAGEPKAPPRMQAEPQAYDQVSFLRDGAEIARYHHGAGLKRPFVFPVIGPSGRSLTRIGHPHDPAGHSHHNSVWVAHNDVNGVVFWGDAGKGRIVQQRIDRLSDDDHEASVLALNAWIDEGSQKTLMLERHKLTVSPLDKGEWMLLVDLQFETKERVTLGKTAFGMIGVRMAKSIGVNDGGGTIRNSEGKVNEKEIFWKPAKWVDYSGAIKPGVIEGVALMDHPGNPNHPSVFHVRNDGWMGASLTHTGARTLEPGKPLRLRYGLYVHAGRPSPQVLERRWETFAKAPLADLTPVKKKK